MKTKIISKNLLERNNRLQVKSLLLSLTSPNQHLIPHPTAVSVSWRNIILTGQSRITWSALLLGPFCPLKEGDLVWNNLFFFSSAHKSLPFCTASQSSFPSAWWDAAQFMNCQMKSIRSSNVLSWILFFNKPKKSNLKNGTIVGWLWDILESVLDGHFTR